MPGLCAEHANLRPLAWRVSPAEVVARWPAHEPLAALVSADTSGRGGRWSVLARPGRAVTEWWGVSRALGVAPRASASGSAETPPFVSGWIGWLGYELGADLEPASSVAGAVASTGPVVRLCRCEGAYAHDSATGRWWLVGDRDGVPAIDPSGPATGLCRATVGALASAIGRDEYESMVSRAVGHIHAGDVFQVNLSRRLEADFAGSPRALFLRLVEAMAPAYGALIEGPGAGDAVVSLSPELFVRVEAGTGRVVTRPIKGTAVASAPAGRLAGSAKDRAELVMIVDLMRNDLGRVCEFGSVHVAGGRSIERHGSRGSAAGVWHGVGTVEGRLGEGATLADLIAASFPAGSITGAPKIRAMQLIAGLERAARGPYCGAVGFVDDSGSASLNVAIRTAVIGGGRVAYAVGAGIVADSDPAAEWDETEAKAAGFRRALVACRAGAAP